MTNKLRLSFTKRHIFTFLFLVRQLCNQELSFYFNKLSIFQNSFLHLKTKGLSLNSIKIFLFPFQNQQRPSISLETDMEPSFLSIGPSHLAVGMNNRAWFYDLGNNSPELSHTKLNSSLEPPKLLFDKEYLGNISNICLNTEYASVLFEGRIFLHQVK